MLSVDARRDLQQRHDHLVDALQHIRNGWVKGTRHHVDGGLHDSYCAMGAIDKAGKLPRGFIHSAGHQVMPLPIHDSSQWTGR